MSKLKYELTEMGNGELLTEIANHKHQWISDEGKWIAWNHKKNRWEDDIEGTQLHQRYKKVLDYFDSVIKDIQVDIDTLMAHPNIQKNNKGSDEYQELQYLMNTVHAITRWRKECQKVSVETNTSKNAKKEGLSIIKADTDSHKTLIGVLNGVADIQTGELLTGEEGRKKLVTKRAAIEYDPEATCEEWKEMLQRLMLGDQEKIDYLQQLLGSALLGENSKYFTFFYGDGSNGKTTVLEIVHRILDEYAHEGEPKAFLAKSKDNELYHAASYHGKRLIVFNESEKEDIMLSESLVKKMTDSGHITARSPYGKVFKYVPQFTPIFSVNNIPSLTDDPALWRRIVIVPFEYVVPDHEKEYNFVDRMVNEHGSGILNWLMEGAQTYLMKNGIDVPDVLREYTNNIRHDMDTLGQFLEEYAIRNYPELDRIDSVELRQEYNIFVTDEKGYSASQQMQQRRFNSSIQKREGLSIRKSNSRQVVAGLDSLVPDNVEEAKQLLSKRRSKVTHMHRYRK